jgi:hypothetical protein
MINDEGYISISMKPVVYYALPKALRGDYKKYTKTKLRYARHTVYLFYL